MTHQRISAVERRDADGWPDEEWWSEDTALDHPEIEYWVRRGDQLVPATDEEVASIRAWERDRATLARLERLKHQHSRWPGAWISRLLHRLLAGGTARPLAPHHHARAAR